MINDVAANRWKSLQTRLTRLAWALGLAFIIHHASFSQPGTWQTHFSYRSAQSVAVIGQSIYAATHNGFFQYDKANAETRLITRDNGLSDVGINRVLALPDQQRLMLVYRSGNIDFLSVDAAGEPGQVRNVNTIATADRIPAQFRGINHINRVGNLAYLSTNFGLVVFDLSRNEIRDTYFSPVTSGVPAPVLMTAILGDSLYALVRQNPFSAVQSIQAVRLSSTVNIADPANWRVSSIPTSSGVQMLVAEQNRLLATTPTQNGTNGAIYARTATGSWLLVQSSAGSAGVFAGQAGAGTFTVSGAGPTLTVPGVGTISGPLLQSPREVVADGTRAWVADTTNGLLEATSATGFRRVSPEGPFADSFQNLFAYPNRLVALTGSNQVGSILLLNQPEADQYEVAAGRWQRDPLGLLNQPFNSAAYLPGGQVLFLGSYGGGLWSQEAGQLLMRVNLPATISPTISALATDAEENLWIATGASGGVAALHVRRPDGRFESFGRLSGVPIVQIVPDDYGALWLRLSYNVLLVFNPTTGQQRYLSTTPGDGNLPGNNVTALVRDRNGLIWVGTDRGVTVFDDPARVFEGNVSANAPIFDRRRLLGTETITAMAVDGGNRKWIATESALYRFGPDGTTLDARFTPNDSPLPSTSVNAIAIDSISGRVFMSTSGGLVSYGGLATEPAETLSGITIFPNPVRPDFTGLVGIRGLTDNSVVKILDAAGQLVYETRAQGGTATWNLQDYRGRMAQTGIYLVVVMTPNGTEGLAGKLAVVR